MKASPFLFREDIETICHCGRNKALRIMHMLEPISFGRTLAVPVENFRAYLQEHGEIKVDWRY